MTNHYSSTLHFSSLPFRYKMSCSPSFVGRSEIPYLGIRLSLVHHWNMRQRATAFWCSYLAFHHFGNANSLGSARSSYCFSKPELRQTFYQRRQLSRPSVRSVAVSRGIVQLSLLSERIQIILWRIQILNTLCPLSSYSSLLSELSV